MAFCCGAKHWNPYSRGKIEFFELVLELDLLLNPAQASANADR